MAWELAGQRHDRVRPWLAGAFLVVSAHLVEVERVDGFALFLGEDAGEGVAGSQPLSFVGLLEQALAQPLPGFGREEFAPLGSIKIRGVKVADIDG